ncbi:TipC family immunity protein [Streptococcus sp. DD11]|uniref:TipC family immunity protein n=1 Tax=Streptococcus sp. DD11 TaxID=1777879 RepID=UPI000AE54DBE|nr:TipC family immunity protein [Streptococcus sp. DD11]
MKKVLLLSLVLAVFLAVGLLLFYQQRSQSSNIFDDIYSDEISYLSSGAKNQMKLLKIKGADLATEKESSDFQAGSVMVVVQSKDLPENSNLNIIANNKEQLLTLDYEEKLADDVQLSLTASYSVREKTLTQEVKLSDYKSQEVIVPADRYENYGLTKAKIEERFSLAEEVLLKEWTAVSESRFSLDNKGKLTVLKKWQ